MLKRYFWILMLMPALVLTGCGKPPEMEISQANEAMQGAMASQADVYAPNEHASAQTAMSQAQAELEAQNAKFVLFRNYGQAKTLYQAAIESSNKAKDAAVVGKEAAKSEAMSLMAEAKTAVGEASKALKTAPRGKDTKADIEAMSTELKSLSDMLMEIDNAMAAEKYMDAKTKGQSVKERAMSIQSEIAHAKEKMGARRKK